MSILGGILGGSALQATGSLMGMGNSFVGGAISNYWNEKQAALNYKYAERYARNSPTWNVSGLRNAGLNPILAVTGGQFSGGSWTPSSASVANVNPVKGDPLIVKQLELLDEQIKGQAIRNRNDEMNMGLTGRDATVARLANELGLTPQKLRDFLGFDMDNRSSSPKSSRTSISDLLNLTDQSRKVFKSYLFGTPRPVPLIKIDKPADISRLKSANSGSESYKQWLHHPSNQRYRTNTYQENEYLFGRDVKSGAWRKKADGKYGYK